MYNISLKYLLSPWIKNIPDTKIYNINTDSRNLTTSSLFIAVIGAKKDGRDFIYKAIAKQVAAILYETQEQKNHGQFKYINNIPIVYFFKLSKYVAIIASRFYKEPAKKIKIIGITGTNGKTTVTQLINQWNDVLGCKTATIGTLGNGFYPSLQTTHNTTPSAIYIQSFLHKVWQKKIKLVTMEVSSHGLVQNRVQGIPFYIGIFTNLSQDHLDYHKNMEQYASAKWLLFTKHKVKKIILNASDKYGKIWLKKLFNYYTIAVTIKDHTQKKYATKWINATYIKYYTNLVHIKFESSWGKDTLYSCLIGKFNVINILLSLACLLESGHNLTRLMQTAKKIKPINGRMQTFISNKQPTFIVDYAHTPDALKEALTAIRLHYHQNYIWCIFGCGGDRDKKKRPLMGEIAEKIADKVIITNDNPRHEKEINIINEILNGCKNKQNILKIINRQDAIVYAFQNAQYNHIIFIAGKGHEETQIIKNTYINYSDKRVILNLLGKDK